MIQAWPPPDTSGRRHEPARVRAPGPSRPPEQRELRRQAPAHRAGVDPRARLRVGQPLSVAPASLEPATRTRCATSGSRGPHTAIATGSAGSGTDHPGSWYSGPLQPAQSGADTSCPVAGSTANGRSGLAPPRRQRQERCSGRDRGPDRGQDPAPGRVRRACSTASRLSRGSGRRSGAAARIAAARRSSRIWLMP